MAEIKYKVVLDDADAKRQLRELLKNTGASGFGDIVGDSKKATTAIDAVAESQKKNRDAQLANIEALRQARLELSKQLKSQSGLNNQYTQGRIDLQQFRSEQAKLNAARKEEARVAREIKKALQENSEYRKLATALNNVRNQSKDTLAEMAKLERQGRKTSAAYQELAQRSVGLVKQTQILDRQIKTIDKTVGQHQRNVGNYTDAISMVAPQISMFAGRLGLLAAGSAAVRKSFQTNLQMEPINQALVGISGTASGFNTNLTFLRETSDRLGLSFVSSSNAFKLWQGAAKYSNLTASQSRGIFESVANAGAKMKLSNEQVEGTFLALSQMMSKGKVQAEELRGQLAERLPGAFQLAAKAMNVTEQELNKMLEKGEVMAQDFLPRFAAQLDISFGNDKTQRIEGMQAAVNRLSNEWTNFWQSERATGFFTSVSDGMARLLKELNIMVNSKDFGEFKAIFWGGQDGHSKYVRQRDLTIGQQSVPVDFSKRSKEDREALINETKKSLDEQAKLYNSYRNEGYKHDLKYYSDRLAYMNRLHSESGGFDNPVSAITGAGLSEADKRKAERAVEQRRQAVERQRALQLSIDAINEQASRNQLSRDAQEVASIRDKYAKIREEARKFYADPKNKGLRVNMGGISRAENFEVSEAATRQETARLTDRLSQQKALYDEYNAYVKQNGVDTANEQYAEQLSIIKSFKDDLMKEYMDIVTLEQTAADGAFSGSTVKLTQAQEERAKALRAMLDVLSKQEQDEARSRFTEALKLAETFSKSELRIRKKYSDALVDLGKEASEEQKEILKKGLQDELVALVEASPEFKKAIEDIDKSSQVMLSNAFRTGKDTIMELIDGMKSGTAEQKAALKKIFGDFFDKGAQDSEAALYDRVAQMVNGFSQLVQSSFQFRENIDGGLSTLSDMVGVASNLAKTMGDIMGKAGEGLSSAGAAGAIAGALLSIGSAISTGINQARQQANAQVQEKVDLQNDRQLRTTEAVTKMLERQLELINEIYGADRLKKYTESLEEIKGNWKDINSQLEGRYMMTGDAFADEILRRLNNGESKKQILKTWSSVDPEWGGAQNVFKAIEKGNFSKISKLPEDITKSREELAKLQYQAGLGNVDDYTLKLINQLEAQIDLYDETMNRLRQEATGSAFSSLLSDVTQLFLNQGADAGQAWTDGFDKVMENYMIQKFTRDYLQEKIQAWYEMMASFAESDGIDEQERDILKTEWDKIRAEGDKKVQEARDILGLDNSDATSSPQGGLSNDIKGIQETTANRLESEFGGLRLAQLQLVEITKSNHVNYMMIANSKLQQLIAIQNNTFRTANNTDELFHIRMEIASMNAKIVSGDALKRGAGL